MEEADSEGPLGRVVAACCGRCHEGDKRECDGGEAVREGFLGQVAFEADF